MKTKRSLVTFAVVGFMALLLCLPVAEVMAGGNNPGTGTDYKQMGPMVKGQLIVGWKYGYDDEQQEVDYGNVEGYLLVEGKLYVGIIEIDILEDTFLGLEAVEILDWKFPTELAEEYNMPPGTLVVVLEEKDVKSFHLMPDLEASDPYSDPLAYRHAFISEVKITFLVPK